MLPSMIEIHDLHSSGKMLVGDIPDPGSAVTEDYDPGGRAAAPVRGFPVKTPPKLFGGFDRPRLAGEGLVANRPALLIRSCLCEDAAEFDFTRVRRLPLGLSGSALRFGGNNRDSCPVHFDIQDRTCFGFYLRKLQLNRALQLGLFLLGNILSDRFGSPLHGFGRDFQARQLRQLLTSLFERTLRSDDSHHAPHGWGIFRAFNVQLPVQWTLSLMANRTHIIGTLDVNPPQSRHDLTGPHFVKAGLRPTTTGYLPRAQVRLVE